MVYGVAAYARGVAEVSVVQCSRGERVGQRPVEGAPSGVCVAALTSATQPTARLVTGLISAR